MPPAADLERLRAECLRALALVAEQQIALFTTAPPPDPDALARRVDAVIEGQGGVATAAGPDAMANATEDARSSDDRTVEDVAESLRAILRETLARYRDPYANYIDPRGHDAYARRRRGDLVGVGLKFRARDDAYPLVLGVLLGGPLDRTAAAAADPASRSRPDPGPRPGDLLVSADGHDLEGLGATDVRDRLAGPEGSRVTLGVRRGDGSARELAVERRTVELHYARAERIADGRIGHVRISRFGTDTHERVRALVAALDREEVRGIVLDLRDNPGGSTRAARAVVSSFDEAAGIYCERLAEGRTRTLPRFGDVVTRRPLAVLVNGRSMSSAEIVAGALQLGGRGRVIGTPTWGKGLIQKVYPLTPPLGGAVRTTIATFSTPDGQPLHARGIVPDIYVPDAPHGLFAERGSLNVSADARAYRRTLLLEDLAARLPSTEARAYAALADTQLAVAVESLGG